MIEEMPGLRVLYISGYLDKGFDVSKLESNAASIQKPFSVKVLALKVRELLDRPDA